MVTRGGERIGVPPSIVTREQLERALELYESQPPRPRHAGSAVPGIPLVDVRHFQFEAGQEEFLAPELMRRYLVVPLYRTKSRLVVAMENPLDAEVIQQIRFVTGQRVTAVRAVKESLRAVIEQRGSPLAFEAPAPEPSPAFDESLTMKTDELTWRLAREPVQAQALAFDAAPPTVFDEYDNTLVQLVNRIIVEAHEEGASDIHVEPRGESDLEVRLRRDGVLRNFLSVPAQFRSALISRIKVMASLDISERRKAQDGKINFKRPGQPDIELRVATIPLANGLEAAVLRILSSIKAVPMADLGLPAQTFKSLRSAIEQPHGLVIVCGPTGSGKTTTLHSLLGYLNSADRKIWTAEDPIEITQPGLLQVQVNRKAGWTFASALHAFLRADPDVIMVGEMRDRETAVIATEAALTGHLVMSTLHTNGAPDAARRLLDIGVDPLSFSDALLGVLAQRLVRRVCPDCAVVQPATAEELKFCSRQYRSEGPGEEPWRADGASRSSLLIARPGGCPACAHTGYRGRVAVYEWMTVSPELRSRLQERASAQELRACAMAQGMKTLRQDGIEKALRGITTLEQVGAVCGTGGPDSGPAAAWDPPRRTSRPGLRLV